MSFEIIVSTFKTKQLINSRVCTNNGWAVLISFWLVSGPCQCARELPKKARQPCRAQRHGRGAGSCSPLLCFDLMIQLHSYAAASLICSAWRRAKPLLALLREQATALPRILLVNTVLNPSFRRGEQVAPCNDTLCVSDEQKLHTERRRAPIISTFFWRGTEEAQRSHKRRTDIPASQHHFIHNERYLPASNFRYKSGENLGSQIRAGERADS